MILFWRVESKKSLIELYLFNWKSWPRPFQGLIYLMIFFVQIFLCWNLLPVDVLQFKSRNGFFFLFKIHSIHIKFGQHIDIFIDPCISLWSQFDVRGMASHWWFTSSLVLKREPVIVCSSIFFFFLSTSMTHVYLIICKQHLLFSSCLEKSCIKKKSPLYHIIHLADLLSDAVCIYLECSVCFCDNHILDNLTYPQRHFFVVVVWWWQYL